MKNFWSSVLATVVGIIFLNILAFIMLFILILAFTPKEKKLTAKANSILYITLDKAISERTTDNPFENINFKTFEMEKNLGLNDILKNIQKASMDENIKGIFLELTNIEAGIATIEAIRNELLKFKESKKFILSYSDSYSQGAYYLATVSDKIYINPQGYIDYRGLRAQVMFYKGALEKLGIEPEVIRHGKFKSAVEPFIEDKMSKANYIQVSTFVGSIWNHILTGISKQRGISIENLNLYADSLVTRNTNSSLKYKMVDGLKYKDQVNEELKKLSGIKIKKEINLISLGKYDNFTCACSKCKGKQCKDCNSCSSRTSKNKIAIVYAVGQIDMGDGDDKSIGSEGLSKIIRKVRLDSTYKAMVLRINSPGGSALASEVIWREVYLTKQKKPVIVSMGDVAASGGYYIAAPATMIVSEPNTITGSIGVFGMLWNAKKLFNDKLGITIDGYSTNAFSDLGSPFRPAKPNEMGAIKEMIENIYDVFITHVSDGRKMTKAQVDSIGQGRVWSGINAKEIGLVDEIGGIDKAIELAKNSAKLKDYKIVQLPVEEEFIQKIIKGLKNDVRINILKEELGENYVYYNNLQKILNIKGVQARLPYDIEIY
jgi:protease IV